MPADDSVDPFDTDNDTFQMQSSNVAGGEVEQGSSDDLDSSDIKDLAQRQEIMSTTAEVLTTSIIGNLSKDTGPIRGNSTALRSLYTGVLTQIKALLGANFGFEALARFLQNIHVSEKRKRVFLESCEQMYIGISVYNNMVTMVDERKKRMTPRDQMKKSTINMMMKLPPSSVDLFYQPLSLDQVFRSLPRADIRLAYKESRHRYKEIKKTLRHARAPSDPISILAWFGFGENYYDLLCSSYSAFQIVVEELKEANNWTSLQISRQDFLDYAYKIYYEEVRGDQQTSISEKNMLQIIVMGVYANVPLEELRPIFSKFSEVQRLGWLKESHQTRFQPFWAASYGGFRRVLDYTRGPLIRSFDSGIHQTLERNRIKFSQMEQYDAAFQIVPRDAWLSGELSGTLELLPFRDFDYKPNKDKPTVNFIAGQPSAGKTTAMGALDCLSSLEGQIPSFVAVSDDTNWPAFACLPQTKLGRQNTSFEFNEGVGLKPQALPVLILNVVKDVKEIPKDELLTKYDRIVKVPSHNSFNLDFRALLLELKKVAEEMGFQATDRDGRVRPPGIIAVRNMRRRGLRKGQGGKLSYCDIEIEDMIQILNSFGSWRRNDHTMPIRMQLEEVAQAGTNVSYGSVNTQAQNFLGANIRDARRHNAIYDISTQQPKDVMGPVKEFAENMFFRKLSQLESAKTGSQLDAILDMLNCKDDSDKVAARALYASGKLDELRLMFWHNKTRGEINLVHINPPTFMPQITSMNPREEMLAVLKANHIDSSLFFRKDRKIDFEALPGIDSDLDFGRSEKEEDSSSYEVDWNKIAG